MTTSSDPAIDSVREHQILSAQMAAERSVLPDIPRDVVQEVALDPPIKVARSFLEHLPASAQAENGQLTRAVLLEHGRTLFPDSSPQDFREFLVLVNAWGYGNSARGLPRTLKVLEDEPQFVASARGALTRLHDASRRNPAVDAYFHLNNRKEGHVRGWGPAFFTKFLAFADPATHADPDANRDQALILDRWIATAVNQLMASELARPATRRSPVRRFANWGWTTPQYAYYLRLVARLAQEPAFSEQPCDGRAMAVERVLFHFFRDGAGRQGGPIESS